MTQVTMLVQARAHGLLVGLGTDLSRAWAAQAQAHLMVCRLTRMKLSNLTLHFGSGSGSPRGPRRKQIENRAGGAKDVWTFFKKEKTEKSCKLCQYVYCL
jgi:hypothetical protein